MSKLFLGRYAFFGKEGGLLAHKNGLGFVKKPVVKGDNLEYRLREICSLSVLHGEGKIFHNSFICNMLQDKQGFLTSLLDDFLTL